MGGTILIVRSRPVPGDDWIAALEARGYIVLSAEEPSQGQVHLRSGGVDAVIVDSPRDCSVNSPLFGFLTELSSRVDAPPFMLVSGSPSAPLESARLGAAAFVPKPCSVDELDEILARLARKTIAEPREPHAYQAAVASH